MNTSVHLTFRDMPVSDAAEARCWIETAELAAQFPGILSCHVTITRTHHWQGDLFDVQIRTSTPGGAVVAVREPAEHAIKEDLDTAIGEAFDTLRERLEQGGPRLKRAAS